MGAAALQIVEEESTVLAALNDDQRRAAQATHKPTLVISPAGTGKTSVLAARYLYMLEQGTPTNRLLAITFSRRAAGEMRERIGSVLHGVDERDIYIDTFHALELRSSDRCRTNSASLTNSVSPTSTRRTRSCGKRADASMPTVSKSPNSQKCESNV